MPTQSDKQLTFAMTIDNPRAEQLTQQLMEFNRTHFVQWAQNHSSPNPMPLHIFVVNEQDEMIGGLTGKTNAIHTWLEVSVLWVKEELRNQGLGRKLMEQAEAEARKRGCLYARLATSHYQAPEFYEKLGYILYGKVDNCPPSETCLYYCKTL